MSSGNSAERAANAVATIGLYSFFSWCHANANGGWKLLLISSLQSRPSSSQWWSDNAHSPRPSWLLNITRICHFLQVWMMNGTHNCQWSDVGNPPPYSRRDHTLSILTKIIHSKCPLAGLVWPTHKPRQSIWYILRYSGCLFWLWCLAYSTASSFSPSCLPTLDPSRRRMVTSALRTKSHLHLPHHPLPRPHHRQYQQYPCRRLRQIHRQLCPLKNIENIYLQMISR